MAGSGRDARGTFQWRATRPLSTWALAGFTTSFVVDTAHSLRQAIGRFSARLRFAAASALQRALPAEKDAGGGSFGDVSSPLHRPADGSRPRRAGSLIGLGRIRYVHPDCGFWMLKRGIADGKMRALVAGRNLHVWTSYKGVDPESNFGSGDLQTDFLTAGPPTYYTLRFTLNY